MSRARRTYLTPLPMSVDNSVDISENELVRKDVGVLETLLKDRSTGRNILWATDDYLPRGAEYAADKTIELPLITGENGIIIQPRVRKNASEQRYRSREKAEVLPPKAICTETYLLVDAFDSKTEAKNAYRYLTTKFARYLIMQATATQHLSKSSFAFVPVLDFSEEWTDSRLYSHFLHTASEIDVVEKAIKEM